MSASPRAATTRSTAARPPDSAPRQLRTPGDERTAGPAREAAGAQHRPRRPSATAERAERALPQPSEFEIHVNRLAFPATELREGELLPIRRLGSDLMDDAAPEREVVDFSPLVPPDYLISPGDEIVLSIWGSVDADLRLFVDRIGPHHRAARRLDHGLRRALRRPAGSHPPARGADLQELPAQRVARPAARRARLRHRLRRPPGRLHRDRLSGMANALVRAGGPSASGSFRDIQLRRGNKTVSKLDFYDLLLSGDRNADQMVQADDVIHVGPIGPQVAVIGSVNRAAIFELKPGETMADALRMAGGFAAVADTTRLVMERVDERATVRAVQIEMANADKTELRSGDVLRAFNAVTLATSQQRQNKRVRVEGEVLRPGDYLLPAQSSIADALAAAGGLTPAAFVFGTDFTRESVRLTQQENYERALRNLETEIALATSTQRITSADEAAAQTGRSAATARLIERLRAIKPTGRVVLQMPPDSRELPKLVLEDGDRLFVPSVPSSVGVFGSVFNAGSYLREEGRTLGRLPAAGRRADARRRRRQHLRAARQRHGGQQPAGSELAAAACAAASSACRRCPATRCSCPRNWTRPPSCSTRRTGRRSWRSSRWAWRRS